MTTMDSQRSSLLPGGNPLTALQKPILVACAYFIGAEAAFLIGTLSDKIFAPFWPPNAILLCALLSAPINQWWLYLLLAFPAHVIAEVGVGMNLSQMLVAFATNCALAVAAAAAIRKWIGRPTFETLRGTGIYILIVGLLAPAVVALGGAFVPISGGENADRYWRFWAEWYASNALGGLTLSPPILIWLNHGAWSFKVHSKARLAEGIALALCLFLACNIAFAFNPGTFAEGFLPSIIYLPVPLIVLAALRFGNRGASFAVLIVTIDLIWRSLGGWSLFASNDSETTVFAIQTFLIGLSSLMLLLGASIDETRAAARRNREIEERMTFAAVSAHTGLWEYNIAENRFWTTDFCRSLFGIPAYTKVSPRTLISTVHPDDRPAATRALRVDLPAGEPAQAEFRVLTPDGATRWVHTQARVYRDERGKPLRIGGVFVDVTQRKEIELEGEERRRDLVHLTRVSILGELSGAIAHEINQPLTAILSNAQAARLMLAQNPPKVLGAIDAIEDIVREDTRASLVISRIRGLLKKGEVHFEHIRLNALITDTLKLLQSEFMSRRIKVKIELEKKLPTIHGDPIQLEQVILNVVMNAIEAMAATASNQRVLTIMTSMNRPGFVEATVKDRGRGIASEHQDRLYEPFFTTKTSGLGLGLSICTTIMKSHGGDLQIVNSPEGGASVSLTLPTSVHSPLGAVK